MVYTRTVTRYWFKRKMYGLGWCPASWQGWILLGLYIVAVISAAYNANLFTSHSPNALFSFFPEVLFYTLIFIIIATKTGESLRWQWGSEKREKK